MGVFGTYSVDPDALVLQWPNAPDFEASDASRQRLHAFVETDAQLIAHDDHRIWHDRLTGRRRLEEEAQQTMNTFEESNKCYHHTAELHKTMRDLDFLLQQQLDYDFQTRLLSAGSLASSQGP